MTPACAWLCQSFFLFIHTTRVSPTRNRITGTAFPFAAQACPSLFPLNEGESYCDDVLSGLQTQLGAAAHAACLTMSTTNDSVEQLTSLSDFPDECREVINDVVGCLRHEAASSLGHVLRVLAHKSTSVCKDCRQLCLNTLVDRQNRAVVDKMPPSPTQLFEGDLDSLDQFLKFCQEVKSAFCGELHQRVRPTNRPARFRLLARQEIRPPPRMADREQQAPFCRQPSQPSHQQACGTGGGRPFSQKGNNFCQG